MLFGGGRLSHLVGRPAVNMLAALVLAVAATVALFSTGSRGPARAAPALAPPGVAAVKMLLAGHAAALRAHDRAAFTAGLASDPAAAAFRRTQLAMFDDTSTVPFARFTWQYDRPATDGAATAAARTRLGPSAVIVRAELQYGFAGVDVGTAEHPVWFTVVIRDGAPRLAADDDLAEAGGASWRGPWDFGPVHAVTGRDCLVLGHPGTGDLGALAAAVDAAVPAVTAVWGTQWTQRVTVEVPSSQTELDAIAGPGFPLASVAAVAIAEPTDSVSEGADAGTGQRIMIGATSWARLSDVGRQVLLRHELTHVATRAVTTATMPTWIVEGFADYVGNLGNAQPVRVVAQELATGIAANGLPAALPGDPQFAITDGSTALAAPGSTVAEAYEQAWLAVRLIADLAGPDAPARFYRAIAATSAADSDPDAAQAAALQQVTGLDTSAFTARWRTALQAQLG